MKLLFLSETNLKDRLSVQNFVFNFKMKEKAILIHDSFGGTVKDTRFVTKRLSSLLSEAMVYNMAFSADQRDYFYWKNDQLQVKKAQLERLLTTVQLLVLGPIVKNEAGEAVLADPLQMLRVAREAFEPSEMIFFVDNSMSPLGSKKLHIQEQADIAPFLSVYEEEKEAMERALSFAPARLLAPSNYSE